MRDCIFCGDRRLVFLEKIGFPAEAAILYSDENFIITPDLVAVSPYHLLIISKEHLLSFSQLDEQRWFLLLRIKEYCKVLLNNDDLLFFEHGAARDGEGGASIDHAHIHVMPRPKIVDEKYIDDYIAASREVFSEKKIATIKQMLELHAKNKSYIYYEIGLNKWIYEVRNIPHQFLRKMFQPIMGDIGYDWRLSYLQPQVKAQFYQTIEFVKSNLLGE